VLTGAVLAAHLVGGWALLQLDSVRQAVLEAAPIMVSLIAPPEQKLPPPLAPQPRQVMAATPVPLMAAAPAPIETPAVFVAAPPLPMPLPLPLPTAAPVVVTAAPEQAPAPPSPAPAPIKQVPPSAVRYLVEPRMTVPLMSRRLGEFGTVVLRIVVDVRGHLKQAAVRKSSGFERLDKQALQEIRTARFAPLTENGQPVEWETLAPMAYELE